MIISRTCSSIAMLSAAAALVVPSATANADDRYQYRCEMVTATESGTVQEQRSGSATVYGKKEKVDYSVTIPTYTLLATGCKPSNDSTPASGKVGMASFFSKNAETIWKDETKTEYKQMFGTTCNDVDAGEGDGNVFGFDCKTPIGA
ncbi:hypothetical protein [Nocardia sp. XZ_19_385]|uniref:hypothetical protein n=1 Tax=Nocardia sp. XZ_19_385 TaxID=2769488 RepID=UPI00188F82CE|nr:hypothetical protein [Nocardia sp. XZ_19_385]